MKISATIPKNMTFSHISTVFVGTNCLSGPHKQFAIERVEASYDETTQAFSAEALLERYTLICDWEPVEFRIIANHPESFNNKGEPQSFLLARLGVWKGLDEHIKAGSGRMLCRRYDVDDLPQDRHFITTLSCYNPDFYKPTDLMYPVFKTAEDVSFSFTVDFEEKPGGGVYNFMDDPVIREKYPYIFDK